MKADVMSDGERLFRRSAADMISVRRLSLIYGHGPNAVEALRRIDFSVAE
jgi:hypothetical protein